MYDKDAIELESVETQAAAEEMCEPIGGYVIYGGNQTTDTEGNVLRMGGKMVADYRGKDGPVDAAEELNDEDRARLLHQQNRHAGEATAGPVVVSGGGDLLIASAAILGGLVARPDFKPGETDDNAIMLAVNLAQKVAEHPAVKAQQVSGPARTIQGAPAGQPSIFNAAQANTMTGPDGQSLYVPPRRVKTRKNGITIYVDPNTEEGKEAMKKQHLLEALGRAATDF